MTWKEKPVGDRNNVFDVSPERAQVFDSEKQASIPIIGKEPDKNLVPIRSQPVIGPEVYEAEYLSKGEDVLFHFWPYGYHDADNAGSVIPRFKPGFKSTLEAVLNETLPVKTIIHDDRDMGAIAVTAPHLAKHLFKDDLCIKVCQDVFTKMGGV